MTQRNDALLAILAGCMSMASSAQALAEPQYMFTPPHSKLELKLAPRDVSSVQVLEATPQRSLVELGQLAIKGDATSTREELVAFARAKAAERGADFLRISSKSGEMTMHSYAPSGGVTGFGFQRRQSAQVLNTAQMLWVQLGAVPKAALGLEFMDRMLTAARIVVKGFKPVSKAAEAGVMIGDEIVAVEGFALDGDDARYEMWKLESQPGQVAHVSIRREGTVLSLNVPLVANIE